MTTFSFAIKDFMNILGRYTSVIDINKDGPLSGILFELSPSPRTLTLTGTNYTVSCVSTAYPLSKIDEEHVFCVKYGALKTWLGYTGNTGDEVTFRVEDSALHAKVGRNTSHYVFMGDTRPFVTHPLGKAGVADVPSNLFADAVDRVADLASAAEHHQVLRNLLFNVGEGYFEFMASDGFVFGWQRGVTTRSYTKKNLLLNASAFTPIRKALGKFETVAVSEDDRMAYFAAKDCYVYTPKSNGQFPEVRPMLAEDHAHKALVSVDGLSRALNASRGFSKQDEGKAVRMHFTGDGEIVVSAPKTEVGTNTDVIRAKQIIGDPISFMVNINYMLTMLGRIDGLEAWVHYDEHEDGSPKPIHVTDTKGNQKFLIAAQQRGYA